MHGVTLFGVTGRRLYATWRRPPPTFAPARSTRRLLITHHFAMADIEEAIRLIKSGRCGKVSLTP